MNAQRSKRSMTPRDLSTMTFIMLAVCGAASVMMIGPVRNRVANAEADLAEAQRATMLAPTLLVDSVAWRTVESRGATLHDRVATHSQGAIDSAALTQQLYDLATTCGLDLSRIQPTPQTTAPALRPDGTPDIAPLAALRVSMDTTASYEAIVQFLDVLEHDLGFVRLESVRLTPVSPNGVASVRATIESVHFAFDPALTEPAPAPVDGMMLGGVQ